MERNDCDVGYGLTDLIDVSQTEQLLQQFMDAVGVHASIIDLSGVVLVTSGWQKICSDFHRVNVRTRGRCLESDTRLANKLLKGKPFSVYRCPNGLINVASSIIIEGQHLANIFISQFLTEKPNSQFFLGMAREFGFDEAEYLRALSEIPVIRKDHLPPLISFLTSFAKILGSLGLKQLKQLEIERELREARKKLEAQNEVLCRYKLIADHSSDIILFTQRSDGAILEANAAASMAYGIDHATLLTMSIDDLSATGTKGLPKPQNDPAGTHAILFETVHRRSDGAFFPVEVSSRGEIISGVMTLVSVIRDITERKQAEHLLRESRKMLQSVLDNIPVRVFWKDMNSIYTGCNSPFALEAGFLMPDEVVGKTDYDMPWTEDAETYQAADRMVISTGKPILGQEQPKRMPDGTNIWSRVSKVPLFDIEGRIKGVLGTYEDITAHRQAEEALLKAHEELERRVDERTAELEKANRELRQIPSILIAVQEEERKRLASELHDSIGQTLAAIKFWVEMALQYRNEGKESTAFDQLEKFVPTLQRSIEETRNIYMGLRPSMLDNMGLLATLEWFRQECMRFFPQRHIELQVQIAEKDIPENLKISIFRIVQEALNNVAKHSNAEWVDISLSKDANGVRLVIADDGIGMQRESMVQSCASTGLGFTSMRERAELTGGKFSVESTPGAGLVIRSYWPSEEEGEKRKHCPHHE